MSIELDDFRIDDTTADFLNWTLQTGIWDGKPVSWKDAAVFHTEIEQKISELLFDDFDRFAPILSWIGSNGEERTLLARDIETISKDACLPVGFRKSIKKLWKEHKVAIIIGAVVLGAAIVVGVVAFSSASVVAAGAAALDNTNEKEPERPAPCAPKQLPQEIASLPPQDSDLMKGKVIFGQEGAIINGQYTPYSDLLAGTPTDYPIQLPNWTPPQNSFPSFVSKEEMIPRSSPEFPLPSSPDTDLQNWFETPGKDILSPGAEPLSKIPSTTAPTPNKNFIRDWLETTGRGIIGTELWDETLPTALNSAPFSTGGKEIRHIRIGFINGMYNTEEEAYLNAARIAKFTGEYNVQGIYNRSHGFFPDLCEIGFLNLKGYSPNTADLLMQNFIEFHYDNLDNPDAKYLQFCHSQATIHLKNALESLPSEIRNRVIVHAFGPAVIIPENLCHEVTHYACEGDLVPYAEVTLAAATLGPNGMPKVLELIKERQDKLIILERHPDTKTPHDFLNPTFDELIENIVTKYIK